MSLGKFIFNVGTSYVFGPVKYGAKLLLEPGKRGKNLFLLGTSLVGANVLFDIMNDAAETGADLAGAKAEALIENGTNVAPTDSGGKAVTSLAAAMLSQQGVDAISFDTINQGLYGTVHPETGVEFKVSSTVLPTGVYAFGVFPVFESYHDYQLPKDMYLQSDNVQFRLASQKLFGEISNRTVNIDLSTNQILQLATGSAPDGYVWHHSEKPGLLQLVAESVHSKTAHTGGRELWGGGEAYR